MSIAEFSSALKDKANVSAQTKLNDMQKRLLQYSQTTLNSKNSMLQAASLLQADSEKFRATGEKQGRTRLVMTKDSAAELISTFLPRVNPEFALQMYLEFLADNYGTLKSTHFEMYSASTGNNIINKPNANSIGKLLAPGSTALYDTAAIRGLNFSHANTLNHVVEFLKKYGAFAGMTAEAAKKQITQVFERGHVYAQTTGRQLLSIGGIAEEHSILDRIVKLSADLDRASSTINSNPIYAQLDAAIQKDFSGSRVYMNIEFQRKYSDSGTGNQDTGKITKGLQILSSLLKLLSTEYDTKKNRLIGTPKVGMVSEAVKSFDNLVKKLDKYTEQMESVLAGYVDSPGKYLGDLKSSPSLNTYVVDLIGNTLSNKKTSNVKVNHPKVTVYKTPTTVGKLPSVQELKTSAHKNKLALDTLKNSISKQVPIRTPTGQFFSASSLQTLINELLPKYMEKNMGKGDSKVLLNYRTGRLAESTQVERMSVSREGMITAFYTYMRNPYGTFSQGGQQSEPPSRDPKLLIAKSIREIAATKVANRMRSVLV